MSRILGTYQFEVNGQVYTLNEKEGLLIAPHMQHAYYGITPVWHNSFITFTGKFEGMIPALLNNRTVIRTSREQYPLITGILHNMIEKYRQFPGDTKDLSADCYRILLEFTKDTDIQNSKSSSLYIDYVAPVIQMIAHLVGFDSPSHFIDIFKKRVGITPHRFRELYTGSQLSASRSLERMKSL